METGEAPLPNRVLRFGVRLAVAAAAAQTVAHFANWFLLDRAITTVDADLDANLVAWASSAATAASAFAALGLALVEPARRGRFFVLAAILAFFSLDDAIALHERVGTRLREDVLGLGSGFGRVVWPLVFLPLLAAAFLLLREIARRAPRPAGRAIRVSLALLVASVALEALSVVLVRTAGDESGVYGLEVALEEGAELAAWTVLAFALAAVVLTRVGSRPSGHAAAAVSQAARPPRT